PDVLLAHVKSVLRRSAAAPADADPAAKPDPLVVGDLVIDPAAHTVAVAGQSIHLPAREFAVLSTLAQEAGYVVEMDDLLTRVWGEEFLGEPQVVYVHIRWLREKIEEDPNKPKRLLTVRGVGYKLVAYEVQGNS
ncbi:MAG: response regulator transcription factor, partial [Anaerolineae bacterium]|nr:response regulator transcription factor [Anaerolineae bacterium]